ncbi:hypothetical protein [Halosimplex pelagicum]|uniref:Uncharacterized protein n=1 Tax=Halosimplex pelagicum TaxID=869886 RepID=A0A7D5T8S4_9EURY|nr:hypothetical protein [Halosimplex pelagicum]QLH81250.1 hypothetical protein HZS54_06180 [Halosimplex pelagicum]
MTERRPRRSIATVVPGVRTDTPKRNVIVLLVYLFLLAIALSGLKVATDLLLTGTFAATRTVI